MVKLTGTRADEILEGGRGADSLTGMAGDDTLLGGDGSDTLSGGTGDDLLDGGSGADRMYGGDGDDTYVVDDIGDRVNEDAKDGIDTVRSSLAAYTLADHVERLVLTSVDGAAGTGNDLDNIITGGVGNDTLDGGAGTDTLRGGAGDDVLVQVGGPVGNERFDGGDGVDTLRLSNPVATDTDNGPIYYVGLSGSTLVSIEKLAFASAAQSNFQVTINLDQIPDGIELVGGAGFDRLIVGVGVAGTYQLPDFKLTSWSANDAIVLAGARAVDYTLKAASVHAGVQILSGNSGNDTLIGGAGSDMLLGAGGDDVMTAGSGSDTMTGGAGKDLFQFDGDGLKVITDFTVGQDKIDLSATVFGGLESIQPYLSSAGDGTLFAFGTTSFLLRGVAPASLGTDSFIFSVDTTPRVIADNGNLSVLSGGAGNDSLSGLAGNDTLYGFGGNDTLDGGTGTDSLVGGTGDDIYVVDSAQDVVVEQPGGGNDTIRTSLRTFSLADYANVERIIFTGTGGVKLTGDAGNNILSGGASADLLDGGDGNDTLNGGAGNDTLLGGAGSDLLDGGSGNDRMVGGDGGDVYVVDSTSDIVVETGVGGIDTIQASLTLFGLASQPTIENLTYVGTRGAILTGNVADNLITGATGADTLFGGSGNDTLNGGSGSDLLIGEGGDDVYIVDNDGDVVVENAGGGIDTILTSLAKFSLAGLANVENLAYTGVSGATLTGNGAANAIVGGIGNDAISGGGGDDVLTGGGGIDRLTGGAGIDRFVFGPGDAAFAPSATGFDTVTDYVDGTDKIALAGSIGAGAGEVLHAEPGIAFASVAQALAYAQTLLDQTTGTHDVAALGVGGDSYLFYNDAGGTTINAVVMLAGVSDPSTIDSSDFL